MPFLHEGRGKTGKTLGVATQSCGIYNMYIKTIYSQEENICQLQCKNRIWAAAV